MIADPITPFKVPDEMRATAERTVEQAKAAFALYMRAAEQTVARVENQVQSSQAGAHRICREVLRLAEVNVSRAFDFANMIFQAKDTHELLRMQTDFVQSQIKILTEQVKDLGETISTAASESVKGSKGGTLSS